MKREEYEEMSFDELMDWAYKNVNDITTKESLKEFAMEKLEDDNFNMVLHIVESINNGYDTEWYRYDYSMGTLETPTPIVDKEDIEDLIDIED